MCKNSRIQATHRDKNNSTLTLHQVPVLSHILSPIEVSVMHEWGYLTEVTSHWSSGSLESFGASEQKYTTHIL